jgi:flavodoxin
LYEIIYYSRSGNTKKLADAIAAEFGVSAESVKEKKGLKPGSFVFLGSGNYGSKPGKDMIKFINEADFKGHKVAILETSGGASGKAAEFTAELVTARGGVVVDKWACKARAFCANQGRPNESDIAAAHQWAQAMRKKA